jgi:hypothetical protein
MHFSSSLLAAALAVGANAQYKRQDYGNFNQTSSAASATSSVSVVAPINTAASIVAPLSTGISTTAFVPPTTETITAYSTYTTDVTLTYTIGSGSSKSAITTIVHKTSTAYITETVQATASASTSGADANTDITSTRTLSSTSTVTNTVTVRPASTASYISFYGEKGGITGSGTSYGAPGTGASVTTAGCAPPSTVTVTALETVYLTIVSSTATVIPKQSSSAPYYPTGASSTNSASTGFITVPRPSGSAQSTGYYYY